ncbi:BaiN/RdsA family NAD(P)/FAD-dependent oxidoreductase [Mongoliitalea daihaiensis]|uniref:NAD(P)/FAD-dependent oxidoreductase n=1 Tax=Mongoliitalea daihaiensis TaxID=2782006 RepID=UPI001F19FEF8|nr:NAD(P)/FAD-dependent oxidoreductase [Mongoliitalea daihaiensis]UJP63901.1 NAD(P)/FAD-dependent oxidoreductase [Mongoliitalea daihaiensis]
MQKLRIGVIGAGAAGYFAAIHASSKHTEVTMLEKTSKTLAKVKISGGGRCNVTHHAPELSKLIKSYPRGGNFLKKVFRYFAIAETIDWFESRGVALKIEQDGRMFPVSDSSQSIINALVAEANKCNVNLLLNVAVHSIAKESNQFEVQTSKGKLSFDRLIICTGGNPKLSGFDFLEGLGHSIVEPIPSLFTFNTPHSPLKSLMGISVPDALVKLEGTKLSYHGPVLITHWGISGPAVLKLSAFGAEWLADVHYKANAHIRWGVDWTESELIMHLQAFKSKHPKKKIFSNPLVGLPQRLWMYLCQESEIMEMQLWENTSKKQFNKLVQNLFCYIVPIEGKTTFKEEFVTAGGVDLGQVHPESMESKSTKGLFFAGEVLNIDGITGGFNFQAAWSTGYLAGKNSQTL